MKTFRLDLQDEPDYEDYPEPIHCIDCGSEDVYWKCIQDRWVLYSTKNNKKHFC